MFVTFVTVLCCIRDTVLHCFILLFCTSFRMVSTLHGPLSSSCLPFGFSIFIAKKHCRILNKLLK